MPLLSRKGTQEVYMVSSHPIVKVTLSDGNLPSAIQSEWGFKFESPLRDSYNKVSVYKMCFLLKIIFLKQHPTPTRFHDPGKESYLELETINL